MMPQNVHPEPADTRRFPRAIIVLQRINRRALLLCGQEFQGEKARLVRREGPFGECQQPAVHTHANHVPRLDVDVGGTTLNRCL